MNSGDWSTVSSRFSAYDTKSKYEKTGEIGRDTEAVLGEVGYTKEQVEALRSQGAAK